MGVWACIQCGRRYLHFSESAYVATSGCLSRLKGTMPCVVCILQGQYSHSVFILAYSVARHVLWRRRIICCPPLSLIKSQERPDFVRMVVYRARYFRHDRERNCQHQRTLCLCKRTKFKDVMAIFYSPPSLQSTSQRKQTPPPSNRSPANFFHASCMPASNILL